MAESKSPKSTATPTVTPHASPALASPWRLTSTGSQPPSAGARSSPAPDSSLASRDNYVGPSRLLNAAPVVKSRRGAVLSRGLVLKSDHYPQGRALDLELYLQGAPNFRAGPDNLGVYGSAQPTAVGLRTILSALGCTPAAQADDPSKTAAWICTREEPVLYVANRPFVLREASHPRRNLTLSNRAENLESIENRLKQDVLREASRFSGVILVHEESGDKLLPMWIAAHDVQTPRELFESVAAEGCPLHYHRIPVASDQDPSDNYLDRFVQVLRSLPIEASVIMNCGMGAVRTTYSMAAAIILRRHQIIQQGGVDPMGLQTSRSEQNGDAGHAMRGIMAIQEQRTRSRSLLLLMTLLQQSLELKSSVALVDVVTSQPVLLDQLQAALDGRYDLILSLLSSLEAGQATKQLVDAIVDACDQVVHLRHGILVNRLRYASNEPDDAEKRQIIRSANKGLERYFFLIAFAAYVGSSDLDFKQSFYQWLGQRSEIINMIRRLRSTRQLYIFSPIHDLSAIGAAEANQTSISSGKTRFARILQEGGELAGDEWARQIVQRRSGVTLRAGTILKLDVWRATGAEAGNEDIRGAPNFRKVPDCELYALAQPTEDGIVNVVKAVKGRQTSTAAQVRPTWVNLREEPIVYIHGNSFVQRELGISLRNMRSYAGITSERLETIEERLKTDILEELKRYDGRLLLHIEQDDGSVVPVWEEVASEDVKTLRDVMREQSAALGFDYQRLPITAEVAPDLADLQDILGIVVRRDIDTPIIVNCQLGRGRSTMTEVLIYLTRQWLLAGGRPRSFADFDKPGSTNSYRVIGNLLRVLQNGREVKAAVDSAIQACGEVTNLLESIDAARRNAEEAGDDHAPERDAALRHGAEALRRYFTILLFASYLNATEIENHRSLQNESSFEGYVSQRPVFSTVEKEIDAGGLSALLPLSAVEVGEQADPDAGQEVVLKRTGRILGPGTLLKNDTFIGLQKLSLPERIEGAPNFRAASLALGGPMETVETPLSATFDRRSRSTSVSTSTKTSGGRAGEEQIVYGTGMPTVSGARAALQRMSAGPNGDREIVWTSMREEPVIYVNDKPYVLRLLDEPMENVIMTGVSAEAVESQERKLKKEVLREAESFGGKILLHDEVEQGKGFAVVATWETVTNDSVMTPRELYESLQDDGYRVDYRRQPVTDEQAPIPDVFASLEDSIRKSLAKGSSAFAFNCQMGRGRTTTGMVACTLILSVFAQTQQYNILRAPSLVEGDRTLSSSMLLDDAVPAQPASEQSSSTWGDERETAAMARGEYRVILQLCSLLHNGTLAKRLTDQAINQCDAVQNLRKAIFDYRKRAESATPGRAQDRLREVAKSYLFRYGLLIAFAGSLLDKADATDGDAVLPFPDWLKKREIPRLLEHAEEDLA